jgi:hypothetical protein
MSLNLSAQKQEIAEEDYQNSRVEMADSMRADGKIYVLVAVIVTLFAGFLIYLVKTEQKIKKVEKSLKDKL